MGAQAAIRRLGQARRTLANAVAHSPQDPEHEVLARLRSVADIERRIVLLASRVEYLGRFLSEISVPEIEAEAQRIRAREANATTAEARSRYQLGIAQREAQIRDARALEGRRDQLLATIDYLLVSLETLPLKLTRLQLLRVEASDYQPTDDPAYQRGAAVQRPRGDRGSVRPVADRAQTRGRSAALPRSHRGRFVEAL